MACPASGKDGHAMLPQSLTREFAVTECDPMSPQSSPCSPISRVYLGLSPQGSSLQIPAFHFAPGFPITESDHLLDVHVLLHGGTGDPQRNQCWRWPGVRRFPSHD